MLASDSASPLSEEVVVDSVVSPVLVVKVSSPPVPLVSSAHAASKEAMESGNTQRQRMGGW